MINNHILNSIAALVLLGMVYVAGFDSGRSHVACTIPNHTDCRK